MKKINIAELLHNCPKGMELYSPIFGEVYLDKIRPHLAIVVTTDKEQGEFKEEFLYDGRYGMNGECMLFPSKEKTTWEGFVPPCEFKDGDIVTFDNPSKNHLQIFIFKNKKENDILSSCYLMLDGDKLVLEEDLYFVTRLATEEEKEKFFKSIKDNGYRWNPETKTLEKLTESKEDRHDEIVMSGIYFDREYYADEVELHLGNYEIEVRDGKTYAIFKNQETKTLEHKFKVGDRIKRIKTGNIYEIIKIIPNYYITNYLGSDIMISFNKQDEYEIVPVEPIFKVGDKIKNKDTVLTIITVQTDSYIVEDEPDNFGILMFSQQDKWELINEPKFKVGDRIKYIYFDRKVAKVVKIHDKRYELDNGKFLEIQDENAYEISYDKFDITTLKPFDKVLARCSTLDKWRIQLFEKYDKTYQHPFICMGYNKYKYCIPYEGNEHLLGKTDDCDKFFKIWKS